MHTGGHRTYSCRSSCAGLNGDVVPDAHGGVPLAAQPETAASGLHANGATEDSATDAWGNPVAAESAAASDGDDAADTDQQAAGSAPGSGGGHSNRQGRNARTAAFGAANATPPIPPDGDAQLRGPEPAAAEAGAASN